MGGAGNETTRVRLVIPSRVQLVDLVHTAAEQMARLAGFDEDPALNVGIAVREAVINAITHGNAGDASRRVDIRLEVRPDGIRARVLDQGKGFDPGDAPDPTDGDNLLATGGRGLLMIRAFVDRVDFRFRRGRGMEVTLVKYKEQGSVPAGRDGDARPRN